MSSNFTELTAWAKGLSDEQLTAVLYEMRNRGAAVAYYTPDQVEAMFEGPDADIDQPALEAWFSENRAVIEETMCDAARDMFKNEAPLDPPAEDEDYSPSP